MKNLLSKPTEELPAPHAELKAVWYVDADSSYRINKTRSDIAAGTAKTYTAVRTLTGCGMLRLHSGKEFLLPANTLAVFHTAEISHYAADPTGWQFYWYVFSLPKLLQETVDRVISVPMSAREQAELERCFASLGGSLPYEHMMAESIFNFLLADWILQALRTDQKNRLTQDVRFLLEKGRCEKRSIPELAREAGMSERSFRNAVHTATGMSPKAYMLKSEMDAAMELLRTTDLSITEISASLGYESPLYFSRVFKKYYGIAPQFVRSGIVL